MRTTSGSTNPAGRLGDRSRVVLVFLAAIWLSCVPKSARGELRYRAIKRIAKEAIDNRDVMTLPPRFEKDFRNREYRYYMGAVFWVDSRNRASGALEMAIQAQLEIQLIRKHRVTARRERDDWWGPYLRRAEALVQEMIQDMRRSNDGRLLERIRSRCDRVRDILREAPETYARQKGLEVIVECAEPAFRVSSIKTTPTAGRVYMIDALHWRIERAKGRNPERAMDRLLPLEDIALAGRYYYRIEWAGGRRYGPERILVKGGGTITLPQ